MKIHEIIPLEADKVKASVALSSEAVKTFVERKDHFMGQVRKVVMYDEARSGENTKDHKQLVTTVPLKLSHVWEKGLTDAIDMSMTKEAANTNPEATAVVKVRGVELTPSLPATALIALEKRLTELLTIYKAIPTLEPGVKWVPDEGNELSGTYVTVHDIEQNRTEKTLEHKIITEATPQHKAQYETFTMDKPVGKISTTKFSGMVSPAKKALWLERIEEVRTAVKMARNRANMAEAKVINVAQRLQEYIHKGD